ILKYKGDTFNYDYSIYAKQAQGFVQLQAERKKWNAFFAANLGYTGYQREGHFLNERFAANSLGKSDALKFSDYGVKAGGQYHITGRHTLSIRGGYISRAPLLQNSFVNPRENNESVKNITSETVISGDISYLLRLHGLTAKLSGYYTSFED